MDNDIHLRICSMRFGASNRRLIRMTGTGIRTRRRCDIAFSTGHRSAKSSKSLNMSQLAVIDRRGRIVVLGELGMLRT